MTPIHSRDPGHDLSVTLLMLAALADEHCWHAVLSLHTWPASHNNMKPGGVLLAQAHSVMIKHFLSGIN